MENVKENRQTLIAAGYGFSPVFDDVYFQPHDPVAESRYVFMNHNFLPQRLRASPTFTVGELGFGSGLNALLAVDLWHRSAPAGSTLQYCAVERYPLSLAQLRVMGGPWRVLFPDVYDLLLSPHYQDACHQAISIAFPDNKTLRLQILVQDVAHALTLWPVKGDAWFLDGFAPAKNPDMWSHQVLSSVAHHTVMGGTFATFTAASDVRRGLQVAGFHVFRTQGYGQKRHLCWGYRFSNPGKF
ncbi:MAG: tRNA (5-methylaminomethyl-2-thiouridine)(34)-methyltransferase MnmD [Alphaproteobacteria bacterium]